MLKLYPKILKKEFPGIKDFGSRNIGYMQQYYSEYQGNEFVQPLVGEISLTKHWIIMAKCKDIQKKQFGEEIAARLSVLAQIMH